MIDALLYAVRDGVRALQNTAKVKHDFATCAIMDDGRPPPRCNDFFVAIHSGRSKPGPANSRNLDDLFGFSATLTMRVTVPLDRAGEQQIARNIQIVPLGQRQGFDHKLEQLRNFLHMNWRITVKTGQTPNSANDNIAAWATGTVYGFVEPARCVSGIVTPRLVGGEWFDSEPEAEEVGLVAELMFDGARRVQPQTASVGVFV